jgi:glycosyltransferase involved in cell wall biosynthesis
MMHLWIAVAWLVALAWLAKLIEAVLGFPRLRDLNRSMYDNAPLHGPAVVAIVPARNEEQKIAGCLRSLLGQDYVDLRVIAVDDRSTDRTGIVMEEIAASAAGRLQVLHIAELPAGWLGKPHAMAVAAAEAVAGIHPDYLLFTDGDVLFAPSAIRRSLAYVAASHADHFVLMPTTVAKTAREGAVLSCIQAMSLWALRPWRVRDPTAKRDAVGIGAFNLLSTSAYKQVGGFEATPMEVLDDLYLGRRIKWAGLRQEVAIGPDLVRVHWAPGARGIVTGMTKNIFAVFRFRPFLLIAAAVWVLLFSVGPAAAMILPSTRLAGTVALFSIAGVYVFCARINRISPLHVLFFPIAGLMVVYAMLRSMLVTLGNGGITWRETFYPLDQLRKNMARMHR